MKIFKIYSVLLLISFTLAFCNKNSATGIYYISNNGNDANDGKTEKTAWKTISKIEPGNTYLLKRGDEFYFNIKKVENTGGQLITIGAYGKGKRPVLSTYKTILSNAWQLHSANIWKVDLKNTANYTGYKNNDNTNVGFIKTDGVIRGLKTSKISLLKTQWDFSSDNQYLYVYSTKNPSTIATSIKIVNRDFIIELSDDMTISDISLYGTGGHAVSGAMCNNINLKNLDISDVGGSYLKKNDTTRFGNGIQFWHGATNCTIEQCKVQNIYDAAYTMQSFESNSIFENITFKNDTAINAQCSFEFWLKNPNSFFKKCKFINNYCVDAGMTWSFAVRPDRYTGVHLLCYFAGNGLTDLTIANNTFINAKTAYAALPLDIPSALMFNSDNNIITLSANTPMAVAAYDKRFVVKDTKSFFSQFGIEKKSIIKILR